MDSYLFKYHTDQFPEKTVDLEMLKGECCDGGRFHCDGIYRRNGRIEIVFTGWCPATHYVDRIVSRHRPSTHPLRVFSRNYPRHFWAFQIMLPDDVPHYHYEKLVLAIRDAILTGTEVRYLQVLWGIAEQIEARLRKQEA